VRVRVVEFSFNDANLQLYGVMITSVDGYKLDVHRIGTHKFVFMRNTFLVITVKNG